MLYGYRKLLNTYEAIEIYTDLGYSMLVLKVAKSLFINTSIRNEKKAQQAIFKKLFSSRHLQL